jgi:hypothetical protein
MQNMTSKDQGAYDCHICRNMQYMHMCIYCIFCLYIFFCIYWFFVAWCALLNTYNTIWLQCAFYLATINPPLIYDQALPVAGMPCQCNHHWHRLLSLPLQVGQGYKKTYTRYYSSPSVGGITHDIDKATASNGHSYWAELDQDNPIQS